LTGSHREDLLTARTTESPQMLRLQAQRPNLRPCREGIRDGRDVWV